MKKTNKKIPLIEQDKNFLSRAYEMMLLMRRFEEKAGQLYGMGQIGGFCHLYIGQEAVATGVQMALKQGDSMVTSYRDHGVMLAAGSDPKTVMAELLGRATGCSKGKGGSMHMFDLERKYYGGHGIVGAQVPIGTGIALANKYLGQDHICVTYFGDGAVNQGQVYESFNMAKLWGLPVLYVIENNEYSMGTAVARGCSTTDLYKRGESFGIEGRRVNGMNFFEVYREVSDAVALVRSKQQPLLLEMKTYRYRGHSMSDPAKYRTKDEVDKYRENNDPLALMEKHLLEYKLLKQADLDAIEKRISGRVKEAVEFAQNSPEPDSSELYTDVYA